MQIVLALVIAALFTVLAGFRLLSADERFTSTSGFGGSHRVFEHAQMTHPQITHSTSFQHPDHAFANRGFDQDDHRRPVPVSIAENTRFENGFSEERRASEGRLFSRETQARFSNMRIRFEDDRFSDRNFN